MDRRKLILMAFLALLFIPHPLAAQSPKKPNPAAWVRKLRNSKALKKQAAGLFPAQILLVESLPAKGDPSFPKVNAKAFNKIGFLKLASKSPVEYFIALNKKDQKLAPKGKAVPTRTEQDWLEILLEVSDADTVLYMPKAGEWQLIQNKDGKPAVIASKEAGEKNPAGIHKWLIGVLGYEGVIIDRQDNYFLIGTLTNIVKNDSQALLLKNSAPKFSMAQAKKEGAGLLQFVSKAQGFAVFELLLGEKPETIPVGTKIALETAKGGKKTAKPKKGKEEKATESDEPKAEEGGEAEEKAPTEEGKEAPAESKDAEGDKETDEEAPAAE